MVKGQSRGGRACLWLSVVMLLIMLAGCATRHQVLRYQTPVMQAENLIPGIEPEEALVKLMVRAEGQGLAPDKGSPAQRRYHAERAAILDGYRRLSERIGGILIEASAMSGDGQMGHDRIMAETRAYLMGAQVMDVRYAEGIAIAEVRVFLAPRTSLFQWDRRVASP
ncbi:hypothetical protein OOT00_11870 [Desulfobotulus sp. H1]|uniref:Flagellar biosynthesis protein FlgP n=1 Tax=Desulfobotulus pelophilus TaxID=2823377 RepID=A0ABT3NB82_9BACT|nr:hypothetical protein [Desulfobotulus pelophilus]MCW7754680.1 hypothetical protein [Desulfobotulus pelophilus]